MVSATSSAICEYVAEAAQSSKDKQLATELEQVDDEGQEVSPPYVDDEEEEEATDTDFCIKGHDYQVSLPNNIVCDRNEIFLLCSIV